MNGFDCVVETIWIFIVVICFNRLEKFFGRRFKSVLWSNLLAFAIVLGMTIIFKWVYSTFPFRS